MFLDIQINLIMLKTEEEQFTLTTKNIDITFKLWQTRALTKRCAEVVGRFYSSSWSQLSWAVSSSAAAAAEGTIVGE